MRKRVLAVASLIASITLSMTGCVAVRAQSDDAVMPLGQKSFEQYASETYEWMAAHRHFVSNNHKQELALHVPFEIKPEKPNGKGVLLIHGFTDSPFNFRDTAEELAEAGLEEKLKFWHSLGPLDEDELLRRLELHIDDFPAEVREKSTLVVSLIERRRRILRDKLLKEHPNVKEHLKEKQPIKIYKIR